ncbi:unnamed protein product [Calypogeia fissa]
MRTSNKTEGHREVGRVLAIALVLVFLWNHARVMGNCDQTAFNLTVFSPETVNLASRSWIDAGGSIRMAPPEANNTNGRNPTVGIGQALYKIPVSLVDPHTNNSISFSTNFSFSLISLLQVSPASNGLAFFIIPGQSAMQGRPEGGSSLSDPYNVTWSNSSSHTFAVYLEKWDRMSSNDLNKINLTDMQPPSTVNMFSTYLEDAVLNFAWIDYDAETLQLEVSVSNTSDGPQWALLSTKYDLSGVFLDKMYIGFYSRDKVSIRSWSFNSAGCPPLLPASGISPSQQPPPRFPTIANSNSGNLTDNSQHSWILIYIGAASGCALLICILAAVAFRYVWLVVKYRGAKSVPDRDLPSAPQIFTYRTLSMATNRFDERALLGRGGFGSVYKGLLAEDDSSTLVAVKRIESRNDAQRERQFIAEVSSIGRLRHRNLVHLLGWCHEKGELLLVYDYMPNGSLDKLLFGTQEKVLPWESRYNIVSGVAEALAYLHGEWEKQVVHRDVKASNVLLDSNFNPRLGDFGLARLIEHNKNPKCSSIAGTLGYLAPEITITGKATDKTDVFSFGALTLELACGRRPIERTCPPDQVVLVDWVWHLHSTGEMMNAMDFRLPRGQFPADKVTTLFNIGLLCSHPDPAARPSMRQVVRMLNGEIPCPSVPDSKPIPPFAAYRRDPDYFNTPTMRAMVASSRPSGNKITSRTQARVSDCSSI